VAENIFDFRHQKSPCHRVSGDFCPFARGCSALDCHMDFEAAPHSRTAHGLRGRRMSL
jgi:hypothetical protein